MRGLAVFVFLALTSTCAASSGRVSVLQRKGRVSPSPLDRMGDKVVGNGGAVAEYGKDNTKSAMGRTKAGRTYENLKSVYEKPPKTLREAGEATAKVFDIPMEAPITSPGQLPGFIARTFWQILATNILSVLISLFFTLLVLAAFGFLYTRFKLRAQELVAPDGNLALLHTGTWRYGVFECLSANKVICCVACFCPSIRWADTMSMAGIFKFWIGFLVFACLYYTSSATAGLTGLVLLGVMTWKRQQIRKLFSMQNGGSTWAIDCCTYCFCACCAIVQEARQLEEAYAAKHPVIESIPRDMVHSGLVRSQAPAPPMGQHFFGTNPRAPTSPTGPLSPQGPHSRRP